MNPNLDLLVNRSDKLNTKSAKRVLCLYFYYHETIGKVEVKVLQRVAYREI